MKFLKKMKDGGPESTVTGYWLVEIKNLFSIVLLKFEGDSREAFHTHAFHALSWLLKGQLVESRRKPYLGKPFIYTRNFFPSLIPIFTSKNNFHKVSSIGTSWALSFRGPWSGEWKEYLPNEDKYQTLTHGRKIKNKS